MRVMDAWRRVLTAALAGLVGLAAVVGLPPAAAAHDSKPVYAAADDHDAEVATFEADPEAVPGLPDGAFLHLGRDLRHQAAPGPVPGRTPLPTRDRSPPRH